VLALILATLTFQGLVEVWHVIILAALLGGVNAFDGPVRQAFVAELVGREDLPNAIALNSMTFNSGRIVGPAIGGLVLVILGPAWCFLLNGVSFIAVIAGLLAMRLPKHRVAAQGVSPWQQFRSGLEYVSRSPDVQALLLLALIFSVFGITYSAVLPAFIDKVLQADAAAFGVINALSGVGAVSGAFVIARYGDRGMRGKWLKWGLIGFPLVLMLFGLNSNYLVAMALSVGLGFGFMLVFTLINTLLQTQIVDEMRGRVLGLYTLTFFGFTPFGNLFIGALAEAIGLTPAFLITALLCLLFSSLVLLKTPSTNLLP
jgi:MFS family permease